MVLLDVGAREKREKVLGVPSLPLNYVSKNLIVSLKKRQAIWKKIYMKSFF